MIPVCNASDSDYSCVLTFVTWCSGLFNGPNFCVLALCKKATIHQITTMLATSKNVLFLGHNHLLTTSTDGSTL